MTKPKLSLKERFRLSRFLRGEKPVNEPVKLTHRRIFILPTRRGLAFVVLVVLLLLIAFIYNNNLVYLLTFLLASVFFITILHSFKAVSGLVIAAAHSQPAFAGEAAGFALTIKNPDRIPRQGLQLTLQKEHSFELAGFEQKTVVLYAQTRKRGWLPCDTVTLSSNYPLGLFRTWSPMRFNLQALVYPKPADTDLPFPESPGVGEEQGQNKKGQDDFYGIKSYQHGDPIRQIHWKAYAKGQGLYSKEYSGGASAELWLDYHVTPGHDLEQRLAQLCRWIIDAEKAGVYYGLLLAGNKIEPGHGPQHYATCLEALALY